MHGSEIKKTGIIRMT